MNAEVTVIVPVWNGERTLARALLSVLDQSLPVARVIVVNDNSTDSTQEIIAHFKARFVQKGIGFDFILNPKSLGPGLARNLGIQESVTKYMAFLDSDDSWHEDKIRIQYEFMNEHQEYFMTCHTSILPKQVPSTKSQDLSLRKIFFRNIVATRTVMIRTEPKCYFNKGLAEDYELWIAILASKKRVRFLSEPIAYHYKLNFSKNGLSGKLFQHEAWELWRLFGVLRHSPRYAGIVVVAILFSAIKFFRRLLIRFLRIVLGRNR